MCCFRSITITIEKVPDVSDGVRVEESAMTKEGMGKQLASEWVTREFGQVLCEE